MLTRKYAIRVTYVSAPLWTQPLRHYTSSNGGAVGSTFNTPRGPTRHTPVTRRPDKISQHIRLLHTITASDTPSVQKKKRIQGVVNTLRRNHIDWFSEVVSDERTFPVVASQLLVALTSAAPFLMPLPTEGQHTRQGWSDSEEVWSASSPYFTGDLNDVLCLCLQVSVNHTKFGEDELSLLQAAVVLQLADVDALQYLSAKLTGRPLLAQLDVAKRVQLLKLISLGVKRCKMPTPPLDYLFSQLAVAEMAPREKIEVLSSLLRLKEVTATELCGIVSRKATADVPAYTVKDVVYALEALSFLEGCHTTFGGAVLERCAVLCPQMTPRDVGNACKFLALLNPKRPHIHVGVSCAKELRRVLPAIVERTEALLGQFSVRDSRYILRCLKEHNVRHSIVLANLSPIVAN